ncbi:MAG: Vms1/Ankzf1 family peptidyl-tRNA hydrolase [Candidatus Rokuibacteriota bacterium]
MWLGELLDRLAAFEPTEHPCLSLYLDAQADQHGQDRFDPFVRKELRAGAEKYTARSPERAGFERDAARITRYLQDELRPSANGVAIFACAGAREFFEAAQIEVPVAEHRLFVAPTPHLLPLARFEDQYPPYAALLADTSSARLFVFGVGERLAEERVDNVRTSRSAAGGWSQARYQRHIENYRLHHAKEVVEALDRLVRDEGIDRIVLAGDDVLVPALRAELPKPLAGRVVGVVRLDMTTPEHEVFRATREVVRAQDAKDDAGRVGRLLDAYHGSGLGVVGVRDTLKALDRGQVDELFISASPSEVESGEDDAARIVDRLVTRARQTAARVTFVEDPALLADVGGVGARLRYRSEAASEGTPEPTRRVS